VSYPDFEAYQGATTYAMDRDCDGISATSNGKKTCAAAMCQKIATEADCVFNPTLYSTDQAVQDQVDRYKCRTCTQANAAQDGRCSATWLKSNLNVAHAGLKGAYCNDRYLVMMSDGSPGFKGGDVAYPNLKDVPYPPGGAGNTCRTRTWSKGFKVHKIPLKVRVDCHDVTHKRLK